MCGSRIFSMKNSFLLHRDSLAVLDALSDEQAGKLFKAMATYHETGEQPDDVLIKCILLPFINQWTRDTEKWERIADIRRTQGSKGGQAKATKSKQKLAKATKSKQTIANDSKRSGSVSVSVNVNDSVSVKEKSTAYPSLDEVITFFTDNGYTRDIAVKAYHYYAEAGWKDSRGEAVRAWKQKMRGVWFKDENKQPQAPVLSSHYNPAVGDVPAVWQPIDQYRPV